MRLVSFRVDHYRNILDSSRVEVQPDITCLVGKNESGKSSALQALNRLRPAQPNDKFSVHEDYPAWLEKRHRMQGKDIDAHVPIEARFVLDKEDTAALEAVFGKGSVKTPELHVSRSYDDECAATISLDEPVIVQNLLSGVSLTAVVAERASSAKTLSELRAISEAKTAAKDDPDHASCEALAAAIKKLLGDTSIEDTAWKVLEPRVPRFFYFAEYSSLPYSVKIRELLQAKPEDLTASDVTALALLRLAGADDEYLLNPDYERRKRELENVANSLTQDVAHYWSQNPELRVLPDITQVTETNGAGKHAVVDELKIRIWDQRHSLSLPFNRHSTGFRWFFSFLAAFSKYECAKTPVIILLDEPALGLHAKAQDDFLRFIEERLAAKCQVIYTTHSPFMVQSGKLERVRMIEDHGQDKGAVVTADVMSSDRDTVFPLQGALGYELAQSLFVGPNNLVVEGTSDYAYIRVVSDHLRDLGRPHLEDCWSIVPVGGADKVPTFVALLGHHLDVTVLVDSGQNGNQRLASLVDQGLLAKKRIMTVGQLLGAKVADIEDLFHVDDYLRLYNGTFGTSLKASELKGTGPIVSRIARRIGHRFEHGRPADYFLRHRDAVLPNLSEKTLSNFEALLIGINGTLAARSAA